VLNEAKFDTFCERTMPWLLPPRNWDAVDATRRVLPAAADGFFKHRERARDLLALAEA